MSEREHEQQATKWHANGTQCMVPEDCSEDWAEESGESDDGES